MFYVLLEPQVVGGEGNFTKHSYWVVGREPTVIVMPE